MNPFKTRATRSLLRLLLCRLIPRPFKKLIVLLDERERMSRVRFPEPLRSRGLGPLLGALEPAPAELASRGVPVAVNP